MCVIHTRILLWFYVAKLATAQLNGEFWWLNDKFVKFSNVQPPQPKFEELSEFDTDESAKIVFRDSNLITNKVAEHDKITSTEAYKEKDVALLHDLNHTIVWPVDNEEKYFDERPLKISMHKKFERTEPPEVADTLGFKFPENDNMIWKDPYGANEELKATEESKNNTGFYNKSINIQGNNESSPITCTYLKERDCYQNNGSVHHTKFEKKIDSYTHFIYCVFPSLKKHKDIVSSKIRFPDDPRETFMRFKRSNNDEHTLNQRNILLQRRNNVQAHETKSTTPRISTSDYEYDDPYWNIKTVSKKSNKQKANKGDYSSNEYENDYGVEVPRPGLVGIYSNYGDNPYNQPNSDEYDGIDTDYDDVDEDEPEFGYSSVDPRKVTEQKIKRKPTKFVEDEETFNAENQTISYHSKPDFNVLQGFKLQLLRNKHQFVKSSRKSRTVESIPDDDSKPNDGVNIGHDEDDCTENRQVFPGCGRIEKSAKFSKIDKPMGETVNGSHPWLALVVPTRMKNSILCYATLVHPRVAITAAHCVTRKAPGEITMVAGIWDMTQISRESRVPSILIHPKYLQGSLSHDLALLYWNRPLELGTNTQPACLADPRVGDECLFFGWGGFDQAIRRRSRWQRASIRSCKGSVSIKNGKDLPSEAFCATVLSRSTVTGVGVSLMCNNEGGMSTVGVAVTRDTTLVMLPIRQWVTSAIGGLK